MMWVVVIAIVAIVCVFALALCKAASDYQWEDKDDEHY